MNTLTPQDKKAPKLSYQAPRLERLGQWQQLTQARGSRPRPSVSTPPGA